MEYHIICDPGWHTRSVEVSGWVGARAIDIKLIAEDGEHWYFNGNEITAVKGCIDVDLNFSPSTNLLPIRRMNLAIGDEQEVQAAWLRFPDFTWEPLVQLYQRMDENTYYYQSAGGRFSRTLQVNHTGFVTEYPGIWQAEAVTGKE